MSDFKKFRALLQDHFNEMVKDGAPLFITNADEDKLYDLYLDSFPAGTNSIFRKRRKYDCSYCRRFVKNIGKLVSFMDGLWHGDSSMLNTGECPNVVKESRLSWILEDNVPQRYYLSARACQGILTRASRRGKVLPELLKNALLEMIEWWEKKAFVSSET